MAPGPEFTESDSLFDRQNRKVGTGLGGGLKHTVIPAERVHHHFSLPGLQIRVSQSMPSQTNDLLGIHGGRICNSVQASQGCV